jgi:hypothetical protein
MPKLILKHTTQKKNLHAYFINGMPSFFSCLKKVFPASKKFCMPKIIIACPKKKIEMHTQKKVIHA